MTKPTQRTVTLGQALLFSNVTLPLAGAYLYYKGTSPRIVLVSCGIAFVVLNFYFLIAFKVWGQKRD
jgi:hypothetical protein